MQVALIAEFEIVAKDRDRFLAAARHEMVAARENEPGCSRFDVIVFDEDDCRGAFIEVFANKAAAELHRELPHFKAFFEAIDGIKVQWNTRHGEAIS